MRRMLRNMSTMNIIKDYPYVIFYIEREDCVDVWRVLHRQRDIYSSR